MGDLLIAACTLIEDKVQKKYFNRERPVQLRSLRIRISTFGCV